MGEEGSLRRPLSLSSTDVTPIGHCPRVPRRLLSAKKQVDQNAERVRERERDSSPFPPPPPLARVSSAYTAEERERERRQECIYRFKEKDSCLREGRGRLRQCRCQVCHRRLPLTACRRYRRRLLCVRVACPSSLLDLGSSRRNSDKRIVLRGSNVVNPPMGGLLPSPPFR